MDPINQAIKLIERSQNILILLPKNVQGDNFNSALALFYTLKKLGKKAKLFLEKVPAKFQFLISENTDEIITEEKLNNNLEEAFPKNFVISINSQNKAVSEMRYEKTDKDLKIYLTLENGEIEDNDISFNKVYKKITFLSQFDLFITLGTKNLEDLGIIFNESPSFFYEIPILNIDNQILNENFGLVNLNEITSISLAEILTKLINSINSLLIDEKVATFLLAGIIFASQSFKNPRTSPKILDTVAFLIEKKADQQKIIKEFYPTKSVSQIRLLGRFFEKLNFDEQKRLYWAALTKEDFQKTETNPKDLSSVFEELKPNLWRPSSLLVLWESHNSPASVKGVFLSLQINLIEKILENFEGASKGNGAMFLIRKKDINLAKEEVFSCLS